MSNIKLDVRELLLIDLQRTLDVLEARKLDCTRDQALVLYRKAQELFDEIEIFTGVYNAD